MTTAQYDAVATHADGSYVARKGRFVSIVGNFGDIGCALERIDRELPNETDARVFFIGASYGLKRV